MAGIREAFEETVASCAHIEDVDAALIESGRTIAARIQDAVDHAEGAELTKVLYLMPHLMNVLREMRATPAARAAVAGQSPQRGRGNLAQLRTQMWGQAS